MLKGISRTRLMGFWFAAVAIMIASAVATGVNIPINTAALLLTVCLVPPAVVLLVWRGAPPPTVGEILYSVNQPKEGRS